MCGIAGLAVGPRGSVDAAFAPTAMRLLSHRGPDDKGYLAYWRGGVAAGREWNGSLGEAEVVLVHRRLSILDLTEAGWQPMSSPDGRYHIVFNGEIYNFVELRAELEQLGRRFKSRCDTEVLLAAYAQWGREALRRLVGMFAFVVLDARERRLFMARDAFGIKPLYYANESGRLLFASELKTVLELKTGSRRINADRLYRFLRYGVSDFGGETMVAEVRQLPPASYAEVSLDDVTSVQPMRYWEVDLSRRLDLPLPEAAARLRELLLESVKLHLRSDVTVGTALSGGIDSSTIVALNRRLLGPAGELHVFGFVADDPSLSEERWLDIAARSSGAQVHKVRISPTDLAADLDKLTRVQDEPFGGTSIYAQYRVFQAASEAGIKVMLDGQGADEILAGYHWYVAVRLGSLLRQGRLAEAWRFWHRAAASWGMGRGRLAALAGELVLPKLLHGAARRVLGREFMPSWLNASWFSERGVRGESFDHGRAEELLRSCLVESLTTQSLPQLLRYEDRNSMAFSIESRVPFLTPKLAEFVLSLPEEHLLGADGTSKAVLRKAMEGLVPQAILDRRDKIGFATPEQQWVGNLEPLVQGMLRGDLAAEIPALHLGEAEREWQRFRVGGAHGAPPWRWVSLMAWARMFKVRFD